MTSILCLHDIVQNQVCSPWEIQATDLERLLDSLLERGYLFCSLNDLTVTRALSIAVTFDDAPGGAVNWILRRAQVFGIRATLFPVVNWLDFPPQKSPNHTYRSLATWQDIKCVCHQGHVIGSHSMSHIPMHTMTDDQIVYELQESKRRLESACALAVNHFAAPFGKLSQAVVMHALAAGYLTVSSTAAGVNTKRDLSSGVLKRSVLRSDLPELGLADNWGSNDHY
jgi:peptidoglycan/xylan/chitin deacetylase (PgdA/CDA1 family)